MNPSQPFTQFIQTHRATPFLLPDQTKYWQLFPYEVSEFKDYADERFERVALSSLPKEAIVWQDGPVLYEGIWGMALFLKV